MTMINKSRKKKPRQRSKRVIAFFFLFALVFFLFSFSVHALSVSLDPVDDALYVEYFFDQAHCPFQITLPHDAVIVGVTDPLGPLSYTFTNTTLRVALRQCDDILFIKFKTDAYWITTPKKMSITYIPPSSFFATQENLSVVVRLPRSFSFDQLSLVYPQPKTELVDDHWLLFFTLHPSQTLLFQYTHKQRFSWLLLFGLLLALFVIVFFVWKSYHVWQLLKKIAYFDEYEQKVLKALIKTDGITQQYLYHQLHLNKSHLSKVIARLERKGLVKKQRQGKINLLFRGPKL